jgi:hypothetical protein
MEVGEAHRVMRAHPQRPSVAALVSAPAEGLTELPSRQPGDRSSVAATRVAAA